jgi:hypothetical protein
MQWHTGTRIEAVASGATEVTPGLRAALLHLVQAARCADCLGADRWEFAVEIEHLLAAGATITDVRWLAASDYATLAIEVTRPVDGMRKFHPHRNLAVGGRTCLVLSAAGVAYAETLLQQPQTFLPTIEESRETSDDLEPRPHWDAARRVLCVGRVVVKRIHRASPNQEAILSAFEEEGWPARIDDPLRPKQGLVAKCRLRDAIRWLNRGIEPRAMRFYGDGSGEAVCWERVAAGEQTPGAARRLRIAA